MVFSSFVWWPSAAANAQLDTLPGARVPSSPAPIATQGPSEPYRPWRINFGAGFRSDLIRSRGLDPFSTEDALPQSALSLAYTRLPGPGFAFGVRFEWNHGEVSSHARSANTTLTTDRLSLGAELRKDFNNRLSVFGRVAGGTLRASATMHDDSTAPGAYTSYGGPPSLREAAWLLAADASAGLALSLGALQSNQRWTITFALTGEVGYAYAATHDWVLRTRAEATAGRIDEPVRLGAMSLAGPFTRFAVSTAF